MNRDQRRRMEKAIRKTHGKSFKKDQIKTAIHSLDALTKPMGIQKGDKVKLNYDLMCPNGKWSGQNEQYHKFVEEHKDEVFTAAKPSKNRNSSTLSLTGIFELAEDTTEPKWLFWGGHLTKVGDEE